MSSSKRHYRDWYSQGELDSLMLRKIFRKTNKSFVFCYHRVIPNETAQKEFVHRALYVTPETFEDHIRWMLRMGRIVGYEEILKPHDIPQFMITFDDGWKDNLDYALPVLNKYGVQALLFISSNNIDMAKLFWTEEICINTGRSDLDVSVKAGLLRKLIHKIAGSRENGFNLDFNSRIDSLHYLLDRAIEFLKRVSAEDRNHIVENFYSDLGSSSELPGKDLLLNWEQIRFMMKNGFRIGSHTHNHVLLDRVRPDVVDHELMTSKSMLENILDVSIDTFSYPNGSFMNPYISESLKKCGYRYAYTLEREDCQDADPFTIPRALVYDSITQNMDKYYLELVLRSYILKNKKIKNYFLKRAHA